MKDESAVETEKLAKQSIIPAKMKNNNPESATPTKAERPDRVQNPNK